MKWAISFIVCAWVIIIAHSLGYCFYEEYEAFIASSFAGKCTNDIPSYVFTSYFLVWGDILVVLYSRWPHFYWYDLFMNTALCIACGVLLREVYINVAKYCTVWVSLFFATGFLVMFLLPEFVNQQYTRTSLSLCISAFVLSTRSSPRPVLHRILIFFLFVSGAMIRYESGVLILILSLCYFSVIHFSDIDRRLGRWLFLAVCLSPIGIYLKCHEITSTNFADKLSPMDEYRISSGYVVPLSQMKSERDSMKYIALQYGVLNDPHNITSDFMKSIVLPGYPLSGSKARYACSYLIDCIVKLRFGFLACAILLAGTMVLTRGRRRWIVLLFCVLFAALLLTVTYIMKMEARVLEPVCAMLFISILFILDTGTLQQDRHRFLIIFLSTWMSLAGLYSLTTTISDYNARFRLRAPVYAKLRKAAENKILVADGVAFMTLFYDHFKPFRNYNFKWAKNILLIDIEAYSLSADYSLFLRASCNCDPSYLGNLFNCIYEQRRNVVIAANPQRLRFFQNYLKSVYQRRYTFIKSHEIFMVPSGELIIYNDLNMVTDPVYCYDMRE